MPGSSPNDANGVPIAVGNTVKLIGTVLGIDLLDSHYGEIKIQLLHHLSSSVYSDPPVGEAVPIIGAPPVGVITTQGGSPPNTVQMDAGSAPPGPRRIINVHASMLVIGS